MSDSATTRGGYKKQDLGDRLNAWGLANGVNGTTDIQDEGIHGVESIALTGNLTLTSTDYVTNQARNFGFYLTDGGLATAPTITVPSVEGRYAVFNATGHIVTIKTTGGTGVTIATGRGGLVLCDGTDCYDVIATRLDQVTAPTAAVDLNSQKITSVATGTTNTDGVNLGQMNTAIASAGVPSSSGAVLISANDTTSRYLEGALVAGTGITLTEDNDGADETLTIDATGLQSIAGTATGNVDMDDNDLSKANLKDLSLELDPDGTISGGTWAIDYRNGPIITATAGANITSITLSNWAPTGKRGALRLQCINFGAYDITFPAAWNWRKTDLTTTNTFADLGFTMPASGNFEIELVSDDATTTVYAKVIA